MNPVVKAQLSEFSSSNPVDGFKEQDYFEVYSIFSTANGILHESVDPFDLHLKGDEFGLDGVGVLVQGENCPDADTAAAAITDKKEPIVEFLFFQAKRSSKFDYGDISKFFDGVYGYFDGGMGCESEQLDDLLGATDHVYKSALRRNPKLRCLFATTGNYESVQRIEKLIDANRSRLEDLNLFEAVDIQLLGAKELQAGYRSATNANSASFEFPKSQTLPDHQSVEQAYIGFVAAAQIMNLVTTGSATNERLNSSVFFDNIRDFNPNSEINKEITRQLEGGDASSFVFKNNGVTVVANAITRTGDRFTLDNYQIVNGCQTCNILFQCQQHIDDVFIPLRLIGSTDEDFVASIIVGTNKQNEVKDEQFWALRPFMKDLEEFCRQQEDADRIFLERRENQYRRESVERTRIVKPSDLLKCVAAMYLFQPNRAARDYRGIRKEFEHEIFQEGHNVLPYYLACLANYRFNFMLRNRRVDKKWKIFKYYVLYVLGIESCDSKDVFKMPRKKQASACAAILEILKDEDTVIDHITRVSKIVDEVIAATGASSRAEIRDQLRLENFAKAFVQAYQAST
ncbi:MAG: hypothetical protein ACI8P0_000780 [Planctomycetaceae bacterium]|jgi:hypothetical protein